MNYSSEIQHDLRKEFHNILGLIKIIRNESLISDPELKAMIDECLRREDNVSNLLDQLNKVLEVAHE